MCNICNLTRTFDPNRHTSDDLLAMFDLTSPRENGTQRPTPDADASTIDEMADYLVNGFWESFNDTSAIDFAAQITATAHHEITVDLTALNEDAQRLARWAFESWELVADIQFTEVAFGGDISFYDTDDGAYTSFTGSSRGEISARINISEDWLAAYGTTLDSYSYSTYVHEIGHALGLGHLGNYNGTVRQDELVFANDSYQSSVMSYVQQDRNDTVQASYGEPVGPMSVDITATQSIYGASQATAGATTWGVDGTYALQFETLFANIGNGQDRAGPVVFAIYDGDTQTDGELDIDIIDLSPSSTDDYLDLNAETHSDIAGGIGNLTMAQGTSIENARIGNGNDTVVGNGAANKIWSNGGKDQLYGGAGNDTLNGGNRQDTLMGEEDNDRLLGKNGSDYLDGGAGDDVLFGGNGADRFFFGSGHDADKIKDFELDSDTLLFSASDFDVQNAQNLLDSYATVKNRGIMLDFSSNDTSDTSYNDSLLLIGVYDLGALEDDILFI